MPPAADTNVLAGRRVLLTREARRARPLAGRLAALGVEVAIHPAIAFEPPEAPHVITDLMHRVTASDWMIFTSVTAVEGVASLLGRDSFPALARARIAAVGPATAAALAEYGVTATTVAPEARAEAIPGCLGDLRDVRCILPRSNLASPALPSSLREAAARVLEVVAYRTVPAPEMRALARESPPDRTPFDAAVFASPSALRFTDHALRDAGIDLRHWVADGLRLVAIGPSTAAAIRAAGLVAHATAADPTDDGLIEAIERCFTRAASRRPVS